MGYTHYWEGSGKLDKTTFALFSEDVKQIIVASEIPICGWDGTGHPEITPTKVSFNGRGDDAHETFSVSIDDDGNFDFCKTARKPYDVVVTASLIALADRFSEVRVSTDGQRSDWNAGMRLFERATHRPAVYPVTE